MLPVKGVGASFKLGSAGSPATLTDLSRYLRNITPSSGMGEYDGTCFQPGDPTPLKETVPGFADKGFALEGVIDSANYIDPYLAELEGVQGVSYEYGPQGTTPGSPKISGTCNVMSYSGPKAPVDGIQIFDVQLKVVTQARGVFS